MRYHRSSGQILLDGGYFRNQFLYWVCNYLSPSILTSTFQSSFYGSFQISQVVQSLRLSTCTAVGMGLIPGQRNWDPICCAAWPKKKRLLYVVAFMTKNIFGCALQHNRILFPDRKLNPCPLHWELRALATGLPGRSGQIILWDKTCQVNCLFYWLFWMFCQSQMIQNHMPFTFSSIFCVNIVQLLSRV